MTPSPSMMDISNTGTTGEALIMAWAHSAEDQSMHDPFVGSIPPIHKLQWWCPTITMLDCLIVTHELQSANMAWLRATGNLESWFAAFSMIMANLQNLFKWGFPGDILWLFGLVSCSNLNLSVAHCSLLPWFKGSIKQIYSCPLMCRQVDSCQVKSKVKSNVASVCDVLHQVQANEWRTMISLWVQRYLNQRGLQNDCVIMNCYKYQTSCNTIDLSGHLFLCPF